ncbi:MAG: efflux RND transporter periplasmic adaptor subunit [Syntrophorhabdus aromaticivorans]|uniref:Efflux RND transporter periplasmic adaptor subunit n=1 Tax=Syntrophorhabdus aromaticivorans TaxID=328301 RepID=A0A971S1B2_9BACT|nr:efflux RND transporter periplasmic adaptor subunit [Syntrophorhabdus aromaticivorans]
MRGAIDKFLLVFFLAVPICVTAAEFRGLIEPHKVVKVGSASEGVLATVNVDRGELVRKGQVLATLQSGVERASMEVARARSEMEGPIKGKEAGKALYEGKKIRTERIYKRQLSSPAEMEEADANMVVAAMQFKEAQENKRLAELEYKRASEVVKRMTILSPIDGVVVDRFLSPGEYVKDQPLMKLAQINPLNIEVIIPAQYFPAIKVGMHATIVPEASSGGEYTAVVKIVDRVIDAASGTFGVRLHLPNPRNRLPAGIKCKVIFPSK